MNQGPKIYLVLTDDWELPGDGSGDMETLQIQNMQKLVQLYEKYRIKGSFFAELMQQITFRQFQEDHRELKLLADRWDNIVKETFRKGHDIQLHIHPQWHEAQYIDSRWNLKSDWALTNHPRERALNMITQAMGYLGNLLKPIDPDYKCVAFRAGGWRLTPSPYILSMLADQGITLDASIVGELHYTSGAYNLDYRNCEEAFLPFYPDMEDARKVSAKKESIVCAPTFHFFEPAYFVIKRKLANILKNAPKKTPANSDTLEPDENFSPSEKKKVNRRSFFTREFLWDLLKAPGKGFHRISDLSLLDYKTLCYMMDKIRSQAKASGLSEVPVILENHTKLIKDFSSIEKFFADLSQASDIQTHTLTELASDLAKGRFPVRTK